MKLQIFEVISVVILKRHVTGEYFTRKLVFCQGPRHFLPKKFLVNFLLNLHIFGKIQVQMSKLGNVGKIMGKNYEKLSKNMIFYGKLANF